MSVPHPIPPFGHEAISASAGSGKTFQLAHRYIGLMARGVDPERICALTFSRKAAGEIFESIVDRICKAAVSASARHDTARHAALPDLSEEQCVGLLRSFVDRLNRLHLGTLDSFMVGVVRAFPTELGVRADFRVMDTGGPEAAELRRSVLARVLDPAVTDEETQRELLEAFRLATFGREEKSIGAPLDAFIESLRERFRVAARPEIWGRAETIWPAGCRWLREPDPDPAAALARLLACAAAAAWPESALERVRAFGEAAADFAPGMPWRAELDYLAPKLIENLNALDGGAGELAMDRKRVRLDAAACAAVLVLLHRAIHAELSGALACTEGIHRVLSLFEKACDEQSRRGGLLSFSDIQFLLTEFNEEGGGLVLSRRPDAEKRLYIDYRLDCSLDHWMLDEFQDTSDLQWSVLGNLADEILQETGGSRTFFYVGDVKQAIYAWRGGNPNLFNAIRQRYDKSIAPRGLHVSYRSVPTVIDLVNRVFGDLSGADLPAGAVTRWAGHWSAHQSAPHLADVAGTAVLVEPDLGPDGGKPTEADRYRVVAGLLREIRPLERGLSVAVLVRGNDSGREVVDCLRRECPGLAVVHEGNASIATNPVVTALVSLLRLAAHPGDRYAERHVAMTPLRRVMAQRGIAPEALPLRVLDSVEEEGFHRTIADWGRGLEAIGALDDYGTLRLGDLLAAAAEFDAGGSRDIDAFLRTVEGRQVRDAAAGHAVRVMTIHQSKGLGFDLVILPDLMNRGMAGESGASFITSREEDTQRTLWTLKAPRRVIAAADETLSACYRAMDVDACFEALCVLYVALTRARRAVYMVTSYPGKSSKALTEAALLKQQLTGDRNPVGGEAWAPGGTAARVLFEAGTRDWYTGVPRLADTAAAAPPAPAAEAPPPARFTAVPRLLAVEPSSEGKLRLAAARLFDAAARDIVNFGSAIHGLLEQVEWMEDADADAILAGWKARARLPADVVRDVERQFRAVLRAPEVKAELARPSQPCTLWREKSFEIVMPGGRWVSGTFDRVTVFGAGPAREAVIVDYKSSLVESDADIRRKVETYRPQLALYAEVLSRLLGIPASRIRCRILFTRAGRVVAV